MKTAGVLCVLLATASCVTEDTETAEESGLQISTLDDTTIAGSFAYAGSVIDFQSQSSDPQYATLYLNVNGAEIDVELDLAAQQSRQNGYLNALYAEDLAALVALRDAVQETYPDLVTDTLHGKLLARHADRLAEAPVGYTFDLRVIDMRAAMASRQLVDRADADGCGGDGVTCLSGKDGWNYAVYDPGSNGTCQWEWTSYGGSGCVGRCGWGCNFLDPNRTWDCFDHDRCVDVYGGSTLGGNSNCGDEFWEADDDYFVTYNPWAC